MKKSLFISMLVVVAMLIYSCSNKSNTPITETSTTDIAKPNTGNNNVLDGNYNASGTITCTIGGVNYSCPISRVIMAPSSVTIQTSSENIRSTGSVTIVCYTANTAISTGEYSASSASTISSVSFVDKNVTPYSATAASAGSACVVNITTLTAASIKGTFTATVSKPIGSSSLEISNGVIDCTINSKE